MSDASPGTLVTTYAPNGMTWVAATLQGGWIVGSLAASIAVIPRSEKDILYAQKYYVGYTLEPYEFIFAAQDGVYFKMVYVSYISF